MNYAVIIRTSCQSLRCELVALSAGSLNFAFCCMHILFTYTSC